MIIKEHSLLNNLSCVCFNVSSDQHKFNKYCYIKTASEQHPINLEFP